MLLTLRDDSRSWLAFVGSNLGFFAGLAFLWRGLARFAGATAVRHEPALWFGALAAVVVLLGPGTERAAWRVVAAYGLQALMVVRMLTTLVRPLRREWPWKVLVPMTGLGALLAAVLLVAALRQAADMSRALEVHRFNEANVSSFFVYLLAAGLFNFSFLALTTARLVARLHEQSHRDALTGLANRRAHEERFQAAWRRHAHGGGRLALVLVDLDHFKRINDEHGHAAGDAVLAETGARLKAAARAEDSIARIGGEEFALLMPGVDAAGAAAAAERVRQALHAPLRVKDREIVPSASLGVACARADDTDPEALFRRADAALYAAKREGRNRVVVAGA